MTSVTPVNATTTTYAYDGNGQRVMKTVGTNPANVYVYDAMGSLIAEYGAANPVSGPRYLSTDNLGSTRLVTKVDGSVDQTFDYLPFGEEIGGTSSTGPSQRFTGQERDTESGVDNFKARYTSGPQGRFQSPDPIGMFVASPANPQSWNLYAYVMNNPLKYIDPRGTNCVSGDGQVFFDDDQGGLSCDQVFSGQGTGDSVTVFGGSPDDLGPINLPYPIGSNQFPGGGGGSNDPTQLGQAQIPNDLVPKDPCNYAGRALDPGAYASMGKADYITSHPINLAMDVYKGFPRGDFLDAQPLAKGAPQQRAAYGNYVYGVFMQAAGVPLSAALSGANAYAFFSGAKYGPANGPTASNYGSLPAANVSNIANGYSAQMNGNTCHK